MGSSDRLAHLRQLHQQAQPSGKRMVDEFGSDDGPHYTDQALVAKHRLMREAFDALPHLLDIAEAAKDYWRYSSHAHYGSEGAERAVRLREALNRLDQP